MSGRVHDRRVAEAVGEAVRLIPTRMRGLVACEFIIGVDPVFAGVHEFTEAPIPGRSYGNLAHALYPAHQRCRPVCDRGPKVVLPSERSYGWGTWSDVHTVVHELGHILDWRIGQRHVADPVSEYARTNRQEAFAEAFAGWVWGDRDGKVDERTEALFTGLPDGARL